MRDPARTAPLLEALLEALAEAWTMEPDLRLGPLLVILSRPRAACPEVFSLEDDALQRRLDRWSAERRGSVDRLTFSTPDAPTAAAQSSARVKTPRR